MRKARTAKLSEDLLVPKGTAAPSHSIQENLGPDRVEQAVLEARIQAAASTPGEKANTGLPIDLSVRLDANRHRQLALAATRTGETAHDVVIAALDAYLARLDAGPAFEGQEVDRPALDGDEEDRANRSDAVGNGTHRD